MPIPVSVERVWNVRMATNVESQDVAITRVSNKMLESTKMER